MMPSEIQSRPPFVLVVDDDATVRYLANQFLTNAGFILHTAANGREALAAISDGLPDIILLDVIMPEMDGFTVCHELRRLPNVKNVPILMVTGLDDVDSIPDMMIRLSRDGTVLEFKKAAPFNAWTDAQELHQRKVSEIRQSKSAKEPGWGYPSVTGS